MPVSVSSSRVDSNALADRHLRELRDASAIPLEVIAERGYRSITTTDLANGDADWLRGQHLPARTGLLIPLSGPDGSNGRYTLKPDQPRTDDKGKPRKYEAQYGLPNCLDVPKRCRAALFDPSVDLFLTEGIKKDDALAGIGKCTIGISGVWNWQKDHHLLPDWDPILPSLEGRRVFVVFDSDAVSKPGVRLAEDDLAINFLEHRGADAYIVRVPPGPNGEKQGIDDFLAAHGDNAVAAFNKLIADTIRTARAEVRQLKAQISARAELDRAPNEQVRATEKLHLAAIFNDTAWKASIGAEAPYAIRYGAIAERTGTSEDSVGATIKTFSGPGGVFSKLVSRTTTDDGQIRSTTLLRPRHPGDVVAMLKAAAHCEPDRGDKASWGGKRTPRCPDHPDAQLIRRETLFHFACGCVVDERTALQEGLKPQDADSGSLLRFNYPDVKPATIVARLLKKAFPDARTAVDLTPGSGNFWSDDEPVDVQVERSPHDFRRLPYADDQFDVPIIDPPHNADLGGESAMLSRYGSYTQAELEQIIREGVAEAWRVARLGVIVKVTEQTHAQAFQPERDWVTDAIGQPTYDVANGTHFAMRSEAPYSVINNGSTYLVFRKGDQRHVDRSLNPQDAALNTYGEGPEQSRLLNWQDADSETERPPRQSPKKKTSLWDCPTCARQMVGGPRCLEHNPALEAVSP